VTSIGVPNVVVVENSAVPARRSGRSSEGDLGLDREPRVLAARTGCQQLLVERGQLGAGSDDELTPDPDAEQRAYLGQVDDVRSEPARGTARAPG